MKADLDLITTVATVKTMLLSLKKRQSDLQLHEAKAHVARLNKMNIDLNAQNAKLNDHGITTCRKLDDAKDQITILQASHRELKGNNSVTTTQLGSARDRIADLKGFSDHCQWSAHYGPNARK